MFSGIETFGFIFYFFHEPTYWWVSWYVSTIGYYGVAITYMFPPIFAVVHIGTTLGGIASRFPGAWDLWLFIWGTLLWIYSMTVHIHYAEPF